MTDIDAIRERSNRCSIIPSTVTGAIDLDALQTAKDRAALLAEVDRLTAERDKAVNTSAAAIVKVKSERDEALAAVESLVCELPGSSIPADVAKALEYGASIVAERDEARAEAISLRADLELAHGDTVRRALAQMQAALEAEREAYDEDRELICAMRNNIEALIELVRECEEKVERDVIDGACFCHLVHAPPPCCWCKSVAILTKLRGEFKP